MEKTGDQSWNWFTTEDLRSTNVTLYPNKIKILPFATILVVWNPQTQGKSLIRINLFYFYLSSFLKLVFLYYNFLLFDTI